MKRSKFLKILGLITVAPVAIAKALEKPNKNLTKVITPKGTHGIVHQIKNNDVLIGTDFSAPQSLKNHPWCRLSKEDIANWDKYENEVELKQLFHKRK